MAVYKVPQDVEADDKLIGPFSFRQFIYLIVVAISIAGAWGLSQLFIPLAIIPLPIIVFFAALALPLRKDQPMEAYLSAVVSFYFLKSHKRFWQPDGIDSFVTIIPPKDADKILTKELDQSEADRRLGFLADVVDTHGWSIRGAGSTLDTSLNKDLYYEAAGAKDMMQEDSQSAAALKQKLNAAAEGQKTKAQTGMKAAAKQVARGKVASEARTTVKLTGRTVPATAGGGAPVSNLPSLEEIRAREETAVRKRREEEGRNSLTYANFLAEQAAEMRAGKGKGTSVSTPDSAKMDLTIQQAKELGGHREWKVSTVAGQGQRVAAKNKSGANEVVISLHHH